MSIRGHLFRSLQAFIAANRRICVKIQSRLALSRPNLLFMYREAVRQAIAETDAKLILDVGGGKSCCFSRGEEGTRPPRVIGLDVCEEEIRENLDVNYRVLADVSDGLPFRNSSIDLVTSHMAMEHLPDTEALFKSSRAVLRSGGYCIHAFACKFAPYAVINQLLPETLSRKIIYFLRPEQRGICGFPAMYNRCYHSAMRHMLRRNGFEVISLEPIFYQSVYFDFFLPLFLTSVFWETVISWLRLKSLCAYLLVVARKRPFESGNGEPPIDPIGRTPLGRSGGGAGLPKGKASNSDLRIDRS